MRPLMVAVPTAVKSILERAYLDHHSAFHRERDPVSLVHSYATPRDREIAAVYAALLAYGNVATILSSVRHILTWLGASPYRSLTERRFDDRILNFRHRFTTGLDVFILSHWLSSALRSHGSVEAFFNESGAPNRDMATRISAFVERLTEQTLPPELTALRDGRSRSLKYLVPSPVRGSACKRLNLFLRWMVRAEDAIDLGIWRRVDTRDLMLPVDTHLLKTLRSLRWTRSKQATWRVVESATARLRTLCPEDPIRYDFSLCHLSMSGGNLRAYRELSGA